METDGDSLIVMTYNIQQANDDAGERSHDRQLALIQKISPDILALQESDSARISLNNNDYVRYYAARLGYHAYYGPTTVTGTFGTAILSKYPLQNPRAVFTFSDVDEIGTAEAEITVSGRTFSVYNVHPDGSDTAMLTFSRVLLERSRGKAYVIALGDYNLRDDEPAFQMIADVYTNAWTSVYPSKIGVDGTDMSGRNRIDHIFFSSNLSARDPVYILPPDSATDHPVHWAELSWEE
jgi:endonuclease/exonuclease/phosphatase family metal-dependent hydrolase